MISLKVLNNSGIVPWLTIDDFKKLTDEKLPSFPEIYVEVPMLLWEDAVVNDDTIRHFLTASEVLEESISRGI